MGLQCEGVADTVSVKKLFTVLKVVINENEYSIKTLPSKMPSKPILLSLNNSEKKQDILRNRRAKGKLTTTDLELNCEIRNIFINEDLPKETRQLHNSARDLKAIRVSILSEISKNNKTA